MKVSTALLCLTLALVLPGCGDRSEQPAATATPMSVEEWHRLPVDQKYELDTFERLRLGDPRLQNQRAWDRFTQSVILPSRKKDLGNEKIQP